MTFRSMLGCGKDVYTVAFIVLITYQWFSEEVVPGLLFADNTCLVASDESDLKKSFYVLIDWCKGVHIPNKKVKRCDVT